MHSRFLSPCFIVSVAALMAACAASPDATESDSGLPAPDGQDGPAGRSEDGSMNASTSPPTNTSKDAREPALPPPLPGLVGHWMFDEGSRTTVSDSSGNGHDGILMG